MKLISNYLSASLLIGILSFRIANCQPDLQSGKLIPVYPGAVLKTDFEPGDSKMCCSFVANDNFDKVIGFYENELKIRSVDPNGLATQLPFLKTQIDEMLKQMPAGMKIRFFVLKVVEFQGQKGAELFEVVYTGKGKVEFEVNPSQFREEDSHFEPEWEGVEGDNMKRPDSKAVNSKVLASALPSEGPAGYQKDELVIDEINGSSVSLTYNKPLAGIEVASISLTIYDYIDSPDDINSQVTPQYENEKAVMVKGKYPGKESTVSDGTRCTGADKIFIVKNRYLVIFSAYLMCDFNIMNQMIDRMKLENLPD